MDYYKRLQASVDYIECNLKENIDIKSIANEANLSLTHFYRVFQAVTGESVKRYLQKRRLSCAAVELITSNRRLIDIVFDYGFNSQEVFTRAFSKMFGITPGKCRSRKTKIVLYEKVNILYKRRLNLIKSTYIEPQIVLNKEFRLVGLQGIVKPGQESIAKLWGEFAKRKAEIPKTLGSNCLLGLCEYMPDITDDSDFTYMACTEVADFVHIPNNMVFKMIPSSKYAVFTHKGSLKDLKNTYDFIYGVWFLESEYDLVEQDTIELYDESKKDGDYEFDIYIPVK